MQSNRVFYRLHVHVCRHSGSLRSQTKCSLSSRPRSQHGPSPTAPEKQLSQPAVRNRTNNPHTQTRAGTRPKTFPRRKPNGTAVVRPVRGALAAAESASGGLSAAAACFVSDSHRGHFALVALTASRLAANELTPVCAYEPPAS